MFAAVLSMAAARFLYLALHLELLKLSPAPFGAPGDRGFPSFQGTGRPSGPGGAELHNLRLVAHIAKKYYSSPADQEDLISIGTIGLIKAVNSFDHTKGARFATYGARCIENEILMHFRAEKKTSGTLSLQEPVDTADGTSLTIIDTLTDDYHMDEELELREEQAALHRLVNKLQGRERQVILLRYGLAGQPPMTQSQVASLLESAAAMYPGWRKNRWNFCERISAPCAAPAEEEYHRRLAALLFFPRR